MFRYRNKNSKSKINSQINLYKSMSKTIAVPTENAKLVLFKNKNKKTESHPDYNGLIEIGKDKELKKYSVAGWINEGKTSREKYINCKVDFSKEFVEKAKEATATAVDAMGV